MDMVGRDPENDSDLQDYYSWEKSSRALRKGFRGVDNKQDVDYVPFTALQEYFGKSNRTGKLLGAVCGTGEPPLASYVQTNYLRPFAILLSIGHGFMISRFVEYDNLEDRNLPFYQRPTHFPESPHLNLWDLFYKRQWKYCPVDLNYNMSKRLANDVILPFRIERRLGRGGSAYIYEIKVDRDYNRLGAYTEHHATNEPPSTDTFVLKNYLGRREAEHNYKTEHNAFRRLKSGNKLPPNIITYHGSFIRDDDYNIILEYADLGTLSAFMQREAPPSSGEDIITFWERLFELKKGLHTIHESRDSDGNPQVMLGWHQDVKPDNILVKSRKEGSVYNCDIVLADFGTSHFKKVSQHQQDTFDKDAHGTYAYGAPEIHRIGHDFSDLAFSVKQDVDIWSLGYVYSEIATWIVHGWKKVEEYRLQRQQEVLRKLGAKDGKLFHDGVDPLESVHTFHKNVKLSRRVDDFITADVLDVIVDDMLKKQEYRLNAIKLQGKAEIVIRLARSRLAQYRSTGFAIPELDSQAWKQAPVADGPEPSPGVEYEVDSDNSRYGESVFSHVPSMRSNNTSLFPEELANSAANEVISLLSNDEGLRPLFLVASKDKRSNIGRFVSNLRRLLGRFSIDLKSEADGKLQADVVYFLRSRLTYIAEGCSQCMDFHETASIFNQLKEQSSLEAEHRLRIERFIQEASSTRDTLEKDYDLDEADDDDGHDEDQSNPEDDGPGIQDLPELSRMRKFIVGSTALVMLRERVQEFVQPSWSSNITGLIAKLCKRTTQNSISEAGKSHLEGILSELVQLQIKELAISFHDDLSVSNQIKGAIEDFTLNEWDWWPLRPWMKPLSHGHARISWCCSCGEQRWEEVPRQFASGLAGLLRQIPRAGGGDPGAVTYELNSLTSQGANASQPGNATASSTAQSHQTPNTFLPVEITQEAGENLPISADNQDLENTFVQLGITAYEDCHLAQIHVQAPNDDFLFEQIRSGYDEKRGFVRKWFGPWQFSHCDFFKFEKFDERAFAPLGPGIPGQHDKDYRYRPKPAVTDRPVSKHEFKSHFYLCKRWHPSSIAFFLCKLHRCRAPCRSKHTALDRIPKRIARIEEEGDARTYFWGIQVVEMVSAIAIFTYHFIMIVPTLIFWMLWLVHWEHEGDLQNASVPFFSVMTIIGLMWAFLLRQPQ